MQQANKKPLQITSQSLQMDDLIYPFYLPLGLTFFFFGRAAMIFTFLNFINLILPYICVELNCTWMWVDSCNTKYSSPNDSCIALAALSESVISRVRISIA